ncbi:uncharacterized protein EV154DRAFT_496092 [Mucor mucedo]|uniref:uncharacterized protein n=1 Tax=Mucor mucedo TaxID=29922 RepID=UPI0022204A7A|nr:uncharacterized protein EV154DRAFT_496092 [Mucor mucedo]KAI7895161.1 hypothetical protein EV154DRAFT_496092 [Mucor mucedo]
MPGNIETVISFDPDEERENLIPQRTSAPNEPPIDNNHKNTEVILLDISPDKKWICYISHQLEEGSQTYKMKKREKRTYLTRRRFTSINPKTGDEETVVDNLLKENIDLEHFSMDITDEIKIIGDSHCKFLSISGDGNYVVLSFCERIKQINGKLWPPKNPNCLVFESKQGVLKLSHKIKCDGRAVFLTKNTLSLALVQSTTIKVYDNFPNNISISFLFDLHPFITANGLAHENAQGHKSYIENAPWIDINKPEVADSSSLRTDIHEDTKRIITFSRHIRHNVLVTPFIDGIVRVWSMIEDGVRLTSFSALNQHVMAFSKHYKYTAAYVEGTRAINIYNVKSGLLVYQLKSRAVDLSASFEVAHIRFCYDGRYIAMSGWEGDQVVFVVWYIEAEELIYRTTVSLTTKPNSDLYSRDRRLLKVVQPFVTRGVNSNGDKCLKGFYTSFENGNLATTFIELDIDRVQTNIDIKWVENSIPTYYEQTEILNNLDEYDGIKCGHFEIKRAKYLIRFGKHTVQLWRLNGNETSGGCAFENDDLIYIRAYKGPHYGIDYSFRETWQIQDFSKILFIGGNSFGRMLVNIKETNDQAYKSGSEPDKSYHTEEIFLPVHELLFPKDPIRRQSMEHLSSVTQNSDEHNEDEFKFNYHKLESACQALHYLSTIYIKSVDIGERTTQYQNNHKILCKKTEHLVKTAIKNIDKESNFFSTIAGSRTLAMLASFEMGKEIIKLIVIQPIPISIFSYAKPIPEIFETPDDYDDRERLKTSRMNAPSIRNFNGTDSGTNSISVNYKMAYRDSPPRFNKHVQNNQSMVSNENVLTVLIEDLSYEMYQLLFNRILADSKKLGPGCLSSLTDALLLLQVEGNVDLLLSSSKNLSYLHIEQGKLGALKSEITHVMKVKTAQKEYISRSRNLETHAIMEQIQTYSSRTLFIYKIKRLYFDYFTSSDLRSDIGFYYRVYIRKYIRMLFDQSKKDPKVLSKVCVVPLPHLNSYSSFPEDRPRLCKSNRVDVITYKDNSAFVQLAIDQDDNSIFHQGDTVLEVMLEYKWKQFARWRFIAICSIHALYYVSYSTGVLFSQELFYHDPEKDFVLDSPGQIISVVLMGISIIILWGQELRQFWNSHCRLNYFLSCYNWIDMASFIFPIYTLLQLVNRWDYFNEVCSISTLILWTHAILRLRAISYFGITLEIIIQLCRNVASVLMIMMLVIFAFSHAIFVLLRLEPDEYFREQFEGTYTSLNGTLSGETTIANVSSDNVFNNIFKTISQVWFFVYGVWDSLQDGEAGDNKVLICISIVFSFITVLIFFNLVIALMSSTVEDVNKLGKKVWVSHFAAVISEIELLWSTKGAKHCRKNNPMYIYYIGSFESVKKQENKLKAETDALEKKLGIDKLRLEATNLVNC